MKIKKATSHGFRGPIGQIDQEILAESEPSDLILNYPRVESLLPAIVTEVDDKSGKVAVHARRIGPATMAFETMTWAKRYKTENLTDPEPEKPSDVVAPGDVIYVRAQNPDPASPEPAATTSQSQLSAVRGFAIKPTLCKAALFTITGDIIYATFAKILMLSMITHIFTMVPAATTLCLAALNHGDTQTLKFGCNRVCRVVRRPDSSFRRDQYKAQLILKLFQLSLQLRDTIQSHLRFKTATDMFLFKLEGALRL